MDRKEIKDAGIALFSFQGKNNAKALEEFEKENRCLVITGEYLPGINNGHKFKPDQKVRLTGLKDYPEFNDEIVTITKIRVDGRWGKAYYFKTTNPDLASQLEWTYEYRLSEI